MSNHGNAEIDKGSKTILIVDDDRDLREVLAMDVAMQGYQTITAENGRQALEMARTQAVDAIISDIRMPGGDGVELLNDLKLEPKESPPLIFITGFSDLTPEYAYHLGASALFSKPFDREMLFGSLERVLKPRDLRWQKGRDSAAASPGFEMQLRDLPDAVRDRRLKLGCGGMFVGMSDPLSFYAPETSFRIHFERGALPEIEGTGILRWVRTDEQPSSPPGIGIEFLHLSDRCREDVIHSIEESRTRSFIPAF